MTFGWHLVCFKILYQFPDFYPQVDPLGAYGPPFGVFKTNLVEKIDFLNHKTDYGTCGDVG